MINPVPVDIARKSLVTGSRNSRTQAEVPISPTRQPQSILKQSSNILTRSLSGISAIEFNQWFALILYKNKQYQSIDWQMHFESLY